MSNLIKYKFSDLYEMGSGISTSKEQAGHGYPFASFSTVINNYFLPDTLTDLMDATEEQREVSSILEGDILITRTSETPDELAMSCVALKDYPNATFSGFVKRLRPKNKDLVYPKYMAFYLRGPYFRKLVNSNTVMTLRASFNEHIFKFMNIYLPSYDTQKQIGDLLYKIEQKIKINNEINDNLQQLIQSVYSYWFNQYNFPNSDGLPYADNSGELIYNNVIKREIPKNWMVETFANNSLSKFIDTGISHFESKNYIATANVDNFTIKDGEWVTYSNRESRANMSPSIYSIWFAKMKNSIKHMCIPENGDWMVKKYVFSTGFSGIQCTKNSFAYFYCLINEPFFERTKDILSHGATQQSVNNDDLNSIKIVVPSLNVLKSFAEFANPLYEKICNIIQENQILSEQRDSLLPLLINGQITID
mgnify:CR=1 FL=1